MTSTPKISQEIWDKKYRLKAADGTPVDLTLSDTWHRVAKALAEPEPRDKEQWEQKFFEIMDSGEFIPEGRIIAGAGSGRAVTLQNCYVSGTIPDSIDGIFNALWEAALTMQQGGGIGMDFSTIRPKGALVKGVAADASGPLSFMDCWDTMCRTILSAGSRRGAMMGVLRCDHPDIAEFIEAKRDPLKLRMFNVSVAITDKFMDAVQRSDGWDLVFGGKTYQTVSARDLWASIMRNTYDHAEPGVVFIDRMNRANNLGYMETFAATNPCAEQPLPPYGACLLGSINLAKLVENPFSPAARVNTERLRKVVATAIRAMDNVVDVSKYPLPQQAEEARQKRRIGLGVTGLADMLLMLGWYYSQESSRKAVGDILSKIARTAYQTSVKLAQEKGAFPAFDATGYLTDGTFAYALPRDLRDQIVSYGIRNSHLLSIAPTGTISLLAGNVSSGIEPIFAAQYTRKVLQPDGSKSEETVEDYAMALWREQGNDGFPPAYEDVRTLAPEAHLLMQAEVQKHVDTSISKTINLPESISFEDFEQVYRRAYDLGCKGCTTYRPNAVTGSVLSAEAPTLPAEVPEPVPASAQPVAMAAVPPRATVLSGRTYKVKLGDDPALYVTINNDAAGKPFEIFFNGKDVAHHAWASALSRMISAVFRRGGDVAFIPDELRSIHDPVGGGWIDGKRVPSMPAAIGDVIAEHLGLSRPAKNAKDAAVTHISP